MARTYLNGDRAAWAAEDEAPIDIAEARRISTRTITACASQAPHPRISRDHKLNPNGRSPILCFIGPLASARPRLVRASRGRRAQIRPVASAHHDEAEIRGHRRTYIGALPGTSARHPPRPSRNA